MQASDGRYRDALIECTDADVVIGKYYLFRARRIPYSQIRGVRRFELSAGKTKYRLWGTGTFTYWANRDWRRARKSVGFFLDVTSGMRPLITPDDPDAFERALRYHLDHLDHLDQPDR